MSGQIAADQVLDAAKALGTPEFTREDLANQLGVEKADIKPAFREARQSGRIEKTRDDAENTGHFKLTG